MSNAKEKCLVFTHPDGSKLALPLKVVAEARAKYYAERDPDTTFESEVEYVMNDSYEGVDWYYNNQNPEDFMGKYFELAPPKQSTLAELIRASSDTSIQEIALPSKEPLSAEKIHQAQNQIAEGFVEAQLQLLGLMGHGELNHIKTAVDMPNGGKYLLQFVHVDGPKTDVQKLFQRRAEMLESPKPCNTQASVYDDEPEIAYRVEGIEEWITSLDSLSKDGEFVRMIDSKTKAVFAVRKLS